MKKQLTILVALALLVSALAAFAEEAATDSAQTAEAVEATEATEVTEATEAMEAGPELPFDDGAWLTSASAGSTIYLPADWTIAEESETGFTAASADGAETVAVEIVALDEPTDLTTYMDSTGESYALEAMANRDAAVVVTDANRTVTFLWDDATLVRLTFTPGAEGTTVADNALAIVGTFALTDGGMAFEFAAGDAAAETGDAGEATAAVESGDADTAAAE